MIALFPYNRNAFDDISEHVSEQYPIVSVATRIIDPHTAEYFVTLILDILIMEGLPVVEVGQMIKVHWPNDDGSTEKVHAYVMGIEKCKKVKQNSLFKYTLRIENTENTEMSEFSERSTRLLHLKWKKSNSDKRKRDYDESVPQIDESLSPKKKQRKLKARSNDTDTPRPSKTSVIYPISTSDSPKGNVLPAHSRIVAPMVGGSELAFRLLCRYGLNISSSKITFLTSCHIVCRALFIHLFHITLLISCPDEKKLFYITRNTSVIMSFLDEI